MHLDAGPAHLSPAAPARLAASPALVEAVEHQDSERAEDIHDPSWSSSSGWRLIPEEPHLNPIRCCRVPSTSALPSRTI